ncbi:MAG: GGDEF domain-containing protein [Patescibacteria group bacterium]
MQKTQGLEEEKQEFERAALTDHLTKLLNRRGFAKALQRQMSVIQRYTRDNAVPFRTPYMILIDLDGFKSVNDIYGHQKGDQVLLAVANILKDVFHRDTDIVCRTGGDEFLIFLSGSTQTQAIALAGLLQKKITNEKQLHFATKHSITASIGVALVDIHQDTKTDAMDSVCETAKVRADQAMYRSKERGRNVVTIIIGDTFRQV